MDERTRPPSSPVARRVHALRQRAVLVWLLALVACGVAIGRAHFTADLSAFLPSSPGAGQRVLVDQLRDGIVSRLILVAIDGGDAATRAALSRRVAGTLRADPQFAAVHNGEAANDARDRQFIFDHRYLLSPAVTPQRFSAGGLHQALGDSLDLLSSSAGLVAKAMLPRDPTGEVAALVDQLDGAAQPASRDGVWVSRDGTRAVLVVQTAAAGSDTDAQARAIDAVRRAFAAAKQAVPNAAATLAMTGPGVFSVDTRDTIRHDVERLSTASVVLIVALLLTLYRSPRTLALGLLPVLTGVAAGIAAVSVAFGTVHGLTLGFGTTLIGEAVDYSIYLFVQSAQAGTRGAARPADATRAWVAMYWPTIRLGVLTSVCGFASMLFSGFPGLVQLGLYSIVGLTAAALVTRFVLPHLRGEHVAIRDVSRIGAVLARAADAAPRLRWPLAVLVIAAGATLVLHRDGLWSRELAALSPVPAQAQALDARLRADVGAPDVRYLVVIAAPTEQAALERAERVAAQLQPLVDRGALAGFETPARFLPSDAAQRARLASLPDADVLAARMRDAVANQPIAVRPDLFAPFIADVEAARHARLLTRADLRGTSMALAVDALLTERDGRWSAMLPLRAPDAARTAQPAPSLDAIPIRAAVARAGVPDALFVDMKAEADRLYVSYVHEDIRLSLAGFAAIAVLLLIALRSPRRVVRALAPLVAAVLVVTAGFALAGVPLTILHLVGMLLIVAVGSNYALFFCKRDDAQPVTPHTLVSLLIANLATVAGFGLLALSRVPLLETFGLTVGPGAMLALAFAAILAPRAAAAGHRHQGSRA
ncbi:TPA: MMPL family transporter [Burkholderia cepacia ATCC 25416]|uniref:MMPL family transporter n=1 Tax=Burkholderia cepacia TaxID=292 RepID=UPI001CF2029D|nr:MMPL family transporter [Burkholderia cepacia]HDR9768271.1 MMPL family transporter [Burkholderia cepacia ATCC 25416]MCA8078091.1 MMPL family transporter [Burkholderia cepacia]HDR9774659.1 MMPL family transporter [Burkholderia cepacia ATCC 25416]HDR9784419.1 MMPL family transporter [Burkholderia cepacia ATCC 25416]HDR9792412.1 MMPL family transporter [Burkholderia cepacia ATCC 25416]